MPTIPPPGRNYALGESQIAAQSIPDAYFRAEALVRIAEVNTSFGNLDGRACLAARGP